LKTQKDLELFILVFFKRIQTSERRNRYDDSLDSQETPGDSTYGTK
jgi:hypothetical protein